MAWQPMKSLEFGAWQPVKRLDYNGFYLPFAKFSLFHKICDVFKTGVYQSG